MAEVEDGHLEEVLHYVDAIPAEFIQATLDTVTNSEFEVFFFNRKQLLGSTTSHVHSEKEY